LLLAFCADNEIPMVKGSKLNLLNYVRIQLTDDDLHLELLVPYPNWPEVLYNKYGWLVRVLTSLESSDELLEFPQRVAFCCDVRFCPSKTGTDDNPDCKRSALGICCDASFMQNDGTIPCRAIGKILGFSPARIQQLQAEAAAKARRLIMSDPSLVEMCHEFHIGGVMPSGEELAADVGRLAGI
jgi:hypothetical protein